MRARRGLAAALAGLMAGMTPADARPAPTAEGPAKAAEGDARPAAKGEGAGRSTATAAPGGTTAAPSGATAAPSGATAAPGGATAATGGATGDFARSAGYPGPDGSTPGALPALHAPPRLKAAGAGERPPPRVMLLPRREGDPLPSAVDASLRESVREGLRRAGAGLVERAGSAAEGACADPGQGEDPAEAAACLRRLRLAVGVTHVVRPTLAAIDRDYALRLELVATDDATVVAAFDERCALCGLHEARARVEAGAALLLAPLIAPPPPPTLLAVVSDPPGAEITLDGAPLGPAPLEYAAGPGLHTLRATHAGRFPAAQEVELREGQRTALHLALAPDLPPPAPPARRGAWVPLALGAPLVAGGVALLVLDGRPRPLGCDPAAGGCGAALETMWPGAAMAAAGAALTTIGAVLVRQRRRARARAH